MPAKYQLFSKGKRFNQGWKGQTSFLAGDVLDCAVKVRIYSWIGSVVVDVK